ncbi:50S ribosomal protein L9 [Candidatus Azambacteria bacterium]|nr:50S ribosomal protein L9 [Candidatus Azambacteria bacterium]MBI2587708.1 50S ribosomal protein L9 [Candidatus Azambacteria bacterium]
MKVILLQDIPKMGKAGDVKTVADGFARNFLFPRGMAKPATESAIKEAEQQKAAREKKAEEELQAIEALAEAVDGLELKVPVRVPENPAGEKKRAYGGVNAEMLADYLQKEGFSKIEKKNVALETPLKEVGEYPVKLEFDHGIEAEIKVILAEEEPPRPTEE